MDQLVIENSVSESKQHFVNGKVTAGRKDVALHLFIHIPIKISEWAVKIGTKQNN